MNKFIQPCIKFYARLTWPQKTLTSLAVGCVSGLCVNNTAQLGANCNRSAVHFGPKLNPNPYPYPYADSNPNFDANPNPNHPLFIYTLQCTFNTLLYRWSIAVSLNLMHMLLDHVSLEWSRESCIKFYARLNKFIQNYYYRSRFQDFMQYMFISEHKLIMFNTK